MKVEVNTWESALFPTILMLDFVVFYIVDLLIWSRIFCKVKVVRYHNKITWFIQNTYTFCHILKGKWCFDTGFDPFSWERHFQSLLSLSSWLCLESLHIGRFLATQYDFSWNSWKRNVNFFKIDAIKTPFKDLLNVNEALVSPFELLKYDSRLILCKRPFLKKSWL